MIAVLSHMHRSGIGGWWKAAWQRSSINWFEGCIEDHRTSEQPTELPGGEISAIPAEQPAAPSCFGLRAEFKTEPNSAAANR